MSGNGGNVWSGKSAAGVNFGHIRRRQLLGALSGLGAAVGVAAMLKSSEAGATKVTLNSAGTAVFAIYDVTDYGAHADGSNASTTTSAVQAAITAAAGTNGVVYFPRGTYAISSQLNVTGTMMLLGAGGRTATTVLVGTQPSGHMFNVTGNAVQFRELRITNNGVGRAVTTSSSSTAFECSLVECTVINQPGNTSDMVYLSGSYSRVYRCEFQNNNSSAYAIRVETTSTAMQVETRIDGNLISGRGIAVSSTTGTDAPRRLRVSSNLFNTGFEQLTITAGSTIDIFGNSFANGTGYGVYLNPANNQISNVFIRGNTMDTAGASAVGVAIYAPATTVGTRDILISDNTISYCGYGIAISGYTTTSITSGGCVGVRIVNNNFASVASTGITLSLVREAFVLGNELGGFGTAYCFSLTGGYVGSGSRASDFIIVRDNFISGRTQIIGLAGTGSANYIYSDNMSVS